MLINIIRTCNSCQRIMNFKIALQNIFFTMLTWLVLVIQLTFKTAIKNNLFTLYIWIIHLLLHLYFSIIISELNFFIYSKFEFIFHLNLCWLIILYIQFVTNANVLCILQNCVKLFIIHDKKTRNIIWKMQQRCL